MKRMKRVLVSMLLIAAMLLSVLSLASCRKEMPNFEMPEGGYDGSEVTIVFYHTMGQALQGILNSAIAHFNEYYPNIHIEHTQIGGYDDVRDQISTELTAQRQPNIAYCYPDHVALYNTAGAVVTLDQFITSTQEITRADGSKDILGLTQAQVDDFVDGYWNEGKSFGDDKMYALPLSKSTELLFYNKSFFDQHGLSVPTTWEEMEAVCRQIKAIDPNCIPLGYDSEANWFITLCQQYGSPYTTLDKENHFLFDNDTNVNFVKELRSWYKEGLVTTQEIYGAYTSTLFTAQGEGEVKSYMSIGSSGGTVHQLPSQDGDGKYPFEVGIASIPQVNPQKAYAISQGPSLCIFQNENPQEVIASWIFMKYLTTDVGFQADFSMASGYVPVIESAKNDPYYQNFLSKADGFDHIAALGASICLAQKDAYFTSPAFNGSTVAREQVGALLQKCMSAEWSEDKVDAEIRKVFKDAIDECKYRS
ncbi:MAG: extracellular solute-binding protein [Clostridia bacterium]|nr:extracellular solute-binding protein [Clostridia bacterium]